MGRLARSLAHDPTAAGGRRRRRRRVSVVFVQHIRDRLAALAHCTAVLRPRQRDPSSLGSARPECSLHRDALRRRRHAPRRLHTGTADRLTDGARPKTDVARRDRREMDLVDNFGTSDVDNLQIRHSYGGLTSSRRRYQYRCRTVYSEWRRNIMLRLWVFVCHDRLALMGRPGDTPRVVPN